MPDEPTIVLLSALEHYAYCPRQCGLIHVEATYRENVYTVRGNQAHARVDSGAESRTREVHSRRNIPLWSERLGLLGKADLVEFRPTGAYPVEYKVGKRRSRSAEIQLCAQVLCLEEMLGHAVPAGAIFYHGLRSRREVAFVPALRAETERMVQAVRDLLETQELPVPVNDRRCKNCSLLTPCMPDVVANPERLRGQQGALFLAYDLAEDAQEAYPRE